MTVYNTDSTQGFFFPPVKPENAPFAQTQEILALLVHKREIGAVDALKQTKAEIDAKSKFNFDYFCTEDDLAANEEIFDHENSKKPNISFKISCKKV